MSVLDSILAAVSGGLHGGVEGYQLGQNIVDRKAQRAQQMADLRLRQQQHDDVVQARVDADKDREAAAADRASAATEAAAEKQREAQRQFIMGMPDGPDKTHMLSLYGARLFPDIDFSDGSNVPSSSGSVLPGAALPMEASPHGRPAPAAVPVMRPRVSLTSGSAPHTDVEPMLPSWLQGPYHASGHKMTFTPEQWANPPMTTQEKQQEQLDLLRKQEAIRHSYDKPPAAPKPEPTDDPSLPNGARAYIASLPAKYDGDYGKADAEFTRELPGLLSAHPRMDVRKARQAFDAGFGAAARERALWAADTPPSNGSIPVTPRNASQPQAAPPGELPQRAQAPARSATLPQPAAALKMNPALASLTTRATDLLNEYRSESDPQRKVDLADQLRALRAQLAESKNGAPPASPSLAAVGASADDIANADHTVTSDDIAALARSILTSNGVPTTDANVRTFVQRNHAALVNQITRTRRSVGRN